MICFERTCMVQACQVILKVLLCIGHQDNKTRTKSYSVNRFPASTCYFKRCHKLVNNQASLYVASTLCNPPTPLQGAHQDSSNLQVQARVTRRRFESTSKQGLGLALSWLSIKSVSFCVSSLPASSPFSTWGTLGRLRGARQGGVPEVQSRCTIGDSDVNDGSWDGRGNPICIISIYRWLRWMVLVCIYWTCKYFVSGIFIIRCASIIESHAYVIAVLSSWSSPVGT